MPEDVAFFVAKNVRANVRELEGALRKVLAYSRFSHKDHQHRPGARGAERPAVASRTGRSASRTSRRRWPTSTRSRSPTCTARSARPALPGRARLPCTWPRNDAEEPARDRRAVRRPRPHHGAARRAQDRRRAQQLTELNQQLHVLEQTLKGLADECPAVKALGTSLAQRAPCPQAGPRQSCCPCLGCSGCQGAGPQVWHRRAKSLKKRRKWLVHRTSAPLLLLLSSKRKT
jgi:chromosomal replication initiator protein